MHSLQNKYNLINFKRVYKISIRMVYKMGKVILTLAFLILLSCCNNQRSNQVIDTENLTEEEIDSLLLEYKFSYESVILVDSSKYMMIPISTKLLDRRISYGKDGYYSDDYPRYWNILFYNQNTGTTTLLTEKKVRISRIYSEQRDSEDEKGTVFKGKILYVIGDEDFNNDDKVDSEDPDNLFSSDLDGMNLERISPVGEHFQYFRVVPETNELLIRTLRDSDGDKKFDRDRDLQIWYTAQLIDRRWALSELIDSTGRDRIENLFFEQWLRNLDH